MVDPTINDAQTIAGGGAMVLAGRYRIVRQLGQGGMGSVWLAEDTQLDGKRFAIKMLPSILVSNKRAYNQLKSEALVSMKLTHPNIVTLRAFEENNGNPFLVMDYIEGRSLDDYLAERGTLTEQETVSLLSPVAAALDYAHTKNIIHRDIKPGNIMIAGDGTPYVLDFGIAREMQEATTRVTGKLSSGTLMYMSPEQLHGAVPKAAQDIYSFATMVYECLSGAPPFTRGQIEYQIENDAPVPLPEDFSIAKMVMSGLAKKSEDRPETCSAILGLSGMKMTSVAIPPRPSAERVAPSRAPSGRQDVAERLLQSAQAVLEVDRMLAEVAKFEGSCKDPKIHSSQMAIKAARGEMESASGTRCMELLEAVKVIFAEAKSAYDDSVAKRHFIDEISEFISEVRGRRELRFESGVDACLHEIEQLKVEVEKASAGAWQELQEKFQRAREKTEAEVRSALEKNREMAEKRRLAEVARRQQEELKKRQELEERKRKEQAEIESCRAKINVAKQEIRGEYEKVVVYVKAHPEYGDCLPIAKEIYVSTNEDEPADLSGICERLKKLEKDLERIRRLIVNHDVVVCATLNGVEVGRASMLYGERRIDLPVRIKRRHRMSQDEGYLLEYARGNRKYYGWFSPSCVKSSEWQCAMVPLHSEPSISEISRAYRKKKPVRFLWDVLVALVKSVAVSVLPGVIAYKCFDENIGAAVLFGIVSVVLEFRFLYCKSMRREMRWAICDDGQHRMLPNSAFDESVLLLNRKEPGAPISLDDYQAKRVESPTVKAAKESPEEEGVRTRKPHRHRILWVVIGCILCVGGLCCWRYWENIQAEEELRVRQAERQAELKAKAERARRKAEAKRREEDRRRQAEEKQKAEEAAERRRREAAELESIRKKIVDEVGSAERKVREAEKYRGDPVGFENHLAALDRAVQKLIDISEPKTATAAQAVLNAVKDAGQKISSELDWLSENLPRREEARRIEKEMKSGLDAELLRFEASSIVADSYSRGMALRQDGNEALRNEDFHLAKTKLDEANAELKRALAAAKAIWEKRTAKEKAIALFKKGEWQNGLESAKAADQDDPELLFWIGTYYDMQGDQRNALLCFIKAAKMGLSDAQLELGRRYEDLQKFAEAKQWYQKAASQGSQQAKEKLRLLSLAQHKKELEEAARREKEAEREREQEEARQREQSEDERQLPEVERTSREFTVEDANTLSRLKFSPSRELFVRPHYEKACDYARKGSIYMPRVRSEYKAGRERGGPVWPELERWLDWWK